jgi:uncharacterized lipoprotein YddW (UPF0748 family)
MLRRALLALLFFAAPIVHAQTPEAPLLETRAVWFATVLQDGGWPVTGADPASQAEALRDRIRTAHALGLNTFIFQAVARGDALYPSTLLPWSPVTKGAGQDPGYDPLAVAVDEAHALGMELHAWINTFRVGDATTVDRFRGVEDPEHVFYAHPEWTDSPPGGEDIWLDPSSEDARAWLVDVVMEIVQNYAVDAVHFDFIRYPRFGLEDDANRFAADPRGFTDIGDWRRDNITRFVRDAADAVLRAKPWVKLGAAPIGNYRDNGEWPALFAFSDVYQESRRWVQEGLLDYLAPQLYFSIGTEPEGGGAAPSPDFEFLVEEWEAESAGRAIFAGIGAYKPAQGLFSAADLPRQIDSSRTAGAEGQVYFRYDHLLQFADRITPRYPTPALPAPMTHRFEIATPTVPGDIGIASDGAREVTLTWSPAEGTTSDPVRSYAVFRRQGEAPDSERPEDLHATRGATQTAFVETFDTPPDPPMYYRVAAVSQLGGLSEATRALSTASVTLPTTPPVTPLAMRLEAYPNPVHQSAVVTYTLAEPAPVRLAIYDLLGRRVALLAEGRQGAGDHEVTWQVGRLAPGTYFYRLETGSGVQHMLPFVRR